MPSMSDMPSIFEINDTNLERKLGNDENRCSKRIFEVLI